MNYFDKNKLLTIVLIALMIVNVTALVTIASRGRIFKPEMERRERVETDHSRERGRGDKQRRRSFAEGLSARLDLTEEQQEKMKELWEDNELRVDPLRKQMARVQKEMNEALGRTELDAELVSQLNDSIANLDKSIRESLFLFNVEIRKLLDEDQLEKYLRMHKRMRGGEDGPYRRGRLNMIQNF